MNRRFFMQTSTGALMGGVLAGAASSQETPLAGEMACGSVRHYCGHEHWGSFAAIGTAEGGYRADMAPGAIPTRVVRLWDLIIDPYLGGWLAAAGCDWNGMAKTAGYDDFTTWWDRDDAGALAGLLPHLKRQQSTGAFQCLRRGIFALHDMDIGKLDVEALHAADSAIGAKYTDIFGWYVSAMAKAGMGGLIRPVHPEFYFGNGGDSAQQEAAFTRTVLRIDPLLDMNKHRHPRRDRLADAIGVEPADAASWRKFLAALFERAASRHCVGIKQLQAYSRSLNFERPDDGAVKFRSNDSDARRVFQDWVMHECCALAHDRSWPHQIHTGTHNLDESSPLPLEALAKRYTKMTLVLLHCWPFLEESGFLAKMVPNVYLDACWQPILNPGLLDQSLAAWQGYIPQHKLMCSNDATSIEMAAGAASFLRERLASGGEWVSAVLWDNAAAIYGNL